MSAQKASVVAVVVVLVAAAGPAVLVVGRSVVVVGSPLSQVLPALYASPPW